LREGKNERVGKDGEERRREVEEEWKGIDRSGSHDYDVVIGQLTPNDIKSSIINSFINTVLLM